MQGQLDILAKKIELLRSQRDTNEEQLERLNDQIIELNKKIDTQEVTSVLANACGTQLNFTIDSCKIINRSSMVTKIFY
jgi:chromosome segregation ATPase